MNSTTIQYDDEAKAELDAIATTKEITTDELIQSEADGKIEAILTKKWDHWFTHLPIADKRRIYDAEHA